MVLRRSIASQSNGRERRGIVRRKNVDASVAKFLLVGRRCPGKRAPIAYGTLPMRKKSTEKSLRKEKSAARVPRDEVFLEDDIQGPRGVLHCSLSKWRMKCVLIPA